MLKGSSLQNKSALNNRLLGTRSETPGFYFKVMFWLGIDVQLPINNFLCNWKPAKYEIIKEKKYYLLSCIFFFFLLYTGFSLIKVKQLMFQLDTNKIKYIAWSAKYRQNTWSCILRQIYFSWIEQFWCCGKLNICKLLNYNQSLFLKVLFLTWHHLQYLYIYLDHSQNFIFHKTYTP